MSATAQPRPRRRGLQRMLFVTTILLVAQFLLGVAVNLFVSIPANHPGADPSNYFPGIVGSVRWAVTDGWAWLAVHTILGLLLAAGSIGVLVAAALSRRRADVAVGVFGFIGIVGAGFYGASFLNYSDNLTSYVMAVGCAVALVAYVTGLFLSREAG